MKITEKYLKKIILEEINSMASGARLPTQQPYPTSGAGGQITDILFLAFELDPNMGTDVKTAAMLAGKLPSGNLESVYKQNFDANTSQGKRYPYWNDFSINYLSQLDPTYKKGTLPNTFKGYLSRYASYPNVTKEVQTNFVEFATGLGNRLLPYRQKYLSPQQF